MSSVGSCTNVGATSLRRGNAAGASSVVSSNAMASGATVKVVHKTNSLNSSQSLFATPRDHRPRSSTCGGVPFNPSSGFQRNEVKEAVAAAIERGFVSSFIDGSRHPAIVYILSQFCCSVEWPCSRKIDADLI